MLHFWFSCEQAASYCLPLTGSIAAMPVQPYFDWGTKDMRKFASFRKCVSAAIAAAVLCAPVLAAEVPDVSAMLRAKQYGAALARTDEYLVGRPTDPQLRFLKGLALAGMGRREEAIAHFTKLSSDYPAMPELYNNLAVLHAAEGQYDKARAALESAVKANPSYARAHENLADMYLQLAGLSYAEMLKLEPDHANVRAKQALVQSAVNYRGETAAAAAAVVAKPAPKGGRREAGK